MEYSELSKDLTKNLDKNTKKSNGIFSHRHHVLKKTLKY